MKRQKSGKTWERVNALMRDRGLDTTTLEIVSFRRGTLREVVIADRIVGSYDCRSCQLTLAEDVIKQE